MPKPVQYRIVPAAPDLYRIQYKTRWFWWVIQQYGYDDSHPREFKTVAEAKQWIGDNEVKNAAINAHLAQPPIYYP